MERITSRANDRIKNVARLFGRAKARREQGRFAVEGVRLVQDACLSGLPCLELYATQDALDKNPALARLGENADFFALISVEIAQKLSGVETAQGVFGVFSSLDNGQDAVTIGNSGLYLLLEDLQDPGNVGAVIRTAEALGIDGVFLSRGCPDLYSSKVLRASMGGVFRLPLETQANALDCIRRCRLKGLPVYAAALASGARPVSGTLFAEGGVVVIGNEGAGISEALIKQCDGSIIIPMAGGAESLNASVAAGIIIWEMTRGGGSRG